MEIIQLLIIQDIANKLRQSYSIFPALSQTLIKLHKVPGHVTEVSLFVTKVPSFILRPASSPRFLGGGVCEERLRGGGGGTGAYNLKEFYCQLATNFFSHRQLLRWLNSERDFFDCGYCSCKKRFMLVGTYSPTSPESPLKISEGKSCN